MGHDGHIWLSCPILADHAPAVTAERQERSRDLALAGRRRAAAERWTQAAEVRLAVANRWTHHRGTVDSVDGAGRHRGGWPTRCGGSANSPWWIGGLAVVECRTHQGGSVDSPWW